MTAADQAVLDELRAIVRRYRHAIGRERAVRRFGAWLREQFEQDPPPRWVRRWIEASE